MDWYIWIDPETGEFIQDKTRIAGLLIEASRSEERHLNILPRCANQSLLADLLQFLTAGDENALIRRQYHICFLFVLMVVERQPSNQKENKQVWWWRDERMDNDSFLRNNQASRQQHASRGINNTTTEQ